MKKNRIILFLIVNPWQSLICFLFLWFVLAKMLYNGIK